MIIVTLTATQNPLVNSHDPLISGISVKVVAHYRKTWANFVERITPKRGEHGCLVPKSSHAYNHYLTWQRSLL